MSGMYSPYEGMDSGQLGPQDIEMLGQLGVSPDKLEELKRQMAQQQAVRFQDGPQMRNAGRVSMAANPMEHIGSVIQRMRARGDMKKTQEQIDAEISAQKAARTQIMESMRQGYGGGASPRDPRQEFHERYAPPTRGSA